MSLVKRVTNQQEYLSFIGSSGVSKLVVVFFTSASCPPCQTISPLYDKASVKYRHVTFLKVDVQEAQAIANAAEIRATPTIKLFKGGSMVAQSSGPDLESLIQQYQGPVSDQDKSDTVDGHFDLIQFVEKNQTFCLNQQNEHPVSNIYADGGYLESDCDEQLLVHIPFTSMVKLHSMKVYCKDTNHAPKRIKIYSNKATLDFDETDTIKPIQIIDLSPEDVKDGKMIPLKYVSFQRVSQVILFIESNQGNAETTKVEKLTFIGSPVLTTNMADFKRVAGKEGEAGH